jgi:hypothetical protein
MNSRFPSLFSSLLTLLRDNHLPSVKKIFVTRHRWLTPVILATQQAEIRRITVQSQHGQIVLKTLSRKPITKKD